MSQTAFEKTIGLSSGQVTQWRHNGFTPNHASQKKLAEAMGITIEELMRETDGSEDTAAFAADHVAQSPAVYIYDGADLAAAQPEFPEKSSGPVSVLPGTSDAAGEYFAFRIDDDSMLPDLKPGDIAVVRRQSAAESGDIVIMFSPGEPVICRKLILSGQGFILEALNRSCEPKYFSRQDADILPVHILGKVVTVIRYYE